MAVTVTGEYKGDFRCELNHQSKAQLITDAPLDNNGKGEAFSPTDLLASGLATCMITIIAIRAEKKKINIGNPTYIVQKEMQSNPRKISQIRVEITMTKSLSNKERDYLEKEAKSCPVALSLHESIKQNIRFRYA